MDGPQDWQLPPVQLWPVRQATQAPPPVPQDAVVAPSAQAPEASQQPAQVLGPQLVVHARLLQVWLALQPWHTAPPVPQALPLVPATQVPFRQQPLAQVVASQGGGRHTPAEQLPPL